MSVSLEEFHNGIKEFYYNHVKFDDNVKLLKQELMEESIEGSAVYDFMESFIDKCKRFADTIFSNEIVKHTFLDINKVRDMDMTTLTNCQIAILKYKMKSLKTIRSKYKNNIDKHKYIDYVIKTLYDKLNEKDKVIDTEYK